MPRLRNRPDRFTWRGDDYAFHRLQDGPTLARLDPYSDIPQRWLLHSGKALHLTGADVRDVAKQVNGTELPETRPAGTVFQTDPRMEALIARVEDLEAHFDALADRLGDAFERIRELEAREPVIERFTERVEVRVETVTAPPPPPPPEPEPLAPESHFADLMLADETAEDAKVRLTEKLKLLRHYLMAPEIKVNADGSFGLLKDEQDELKDLERRQTQGRWLDA